MSRVENIVNPRLEVRVDGSFRAGGMSISGHRDQDSETIRQHRMLEDRIKKHVEDESGQAPEVVWRFEREYVCSHCQLTWETDEATGGPVCCDTAQAEWEAAS